MSSNFYFKKIFIFIHNFLKKSSFQIPSSKKKTKEKIEIFPWIFLEVSCWHDIRSGFLRNFNVCSNFWGAFLINNFLIKKTILNDKLILGSKKAQKFLEKLCLSKKHKIYIYTYPIIGVVNPTWNEFSNLYTSDWLFDIFSLTESEAMEAQALYDFNARSAREVNFHKGDTLVLFKQVSNDWWKGSVRGQEGLIPDKYIMLKMRYVNIFSWNWCSYYF